MANGNKTQPTNVPVEEFLTTADPKRQEEAAVLIDMMGQISGEKPVMWGPSIIGFGTAHYKYDTGREGDMPILGFSPRKSALTLYFDGFDNYADLLSLLGKHKVSAACLYINKLDDIDIDILRKMNEALYKRHTDKREIATVEEYVDNLPPATRPHFDQLRTIVSQQLPDAAEVISYGIIGYKIDKKRPRVFISGWKDHVAVYPIPIDSELQPALQPYIKGKGTLSFPLNQPLPPEELIIRIVKALTK